MITFWDKLTLDFQINRWTKRLKIDKKYILGHVLSHDEMDKISSDKKRGNSSGLMTVGKCYTGRYKEDKRRNASDLYFREGNLSNNDIVHELLHHKHHTWSEFRVRKNAARICREPFDTKRHRDIIKRFYK